MVRRGGRAYTRFVARTNMGPSPRGGATMRLRHFAGPGGTWPCALRECCGCTRSRHQSKNIARGCLGLPHLIQRETQRVCPGDRFLAARLSRGCQRPWIVHDHRSCCGRKSLTGAGMVPNFAGPRARETCAPPLLQPGTCDGGPSGGGAEPLAVQDVLDVRSSQAQDDQH